MELIPRQYPNGQRLLNAAVVRSGAIEVEVATFDGFSVVDGFARTDSVRITGDSLVHELLWQHNGKTYSLDALPKELQGKANRNLGDCTPTTLFVHIRLTGYFGCQATYQQPTRPHAS